MCNSTLMTYPESQANKIQNKNLQKDQKKPKTTRETEKTSESKAPEDAKEDDLDKPVESVPLKTSKSKGTGFKK